MDRKTTFKHGDRVRFRRDVERHPHCYVKAEEFGTVVTQKPENGPDLVLAVKLDRHEPGLDEWDNCVHWYSDEEYGHGKPEDDLEVLPYRVVKLTLRLAGTVEEVNEGLDNIAGLETIMDYDVEEQQELAEAYWLEVRS